MTPCDVCGAVGQEPCRTRSGATARSWHKARTESAPVAGPLEAACIRSLAAATWLTDADELSRSLVLKMCRALDASVTHSGQPMLLAPPEGEAVTKESGRLYYGSQTIMQLLDRLGLTPAGRKALDIDDGDDADEVADAVQRFGHVRVVGSVRPSTATDLDTAQ